MSPLFGKFLQICFLLSGVILVCSFSDCSDTNRSNIAIVTASAANHPDAVPVYTYQTIKTYPHDRNAFTQGLVFEDGILFEGTGIRGRSTLRRVALETGDNLQLRRLPPQFFGEGVAVFGSKIVQLT